MKINKKRFLITIGVILCTLGIYLGTFNYLNIKVDNAYNKMNLAILDWNEKDKKEKEKIKEEIVNISTNNKDSNISDSNEQNKDKTTTKKDKYEKYYIARLTIPKINLEKGLVDIKSKYNHVDKNIQIVNGSSYPNVKSGNFILASHSGNSSISYFRNLYKLVIGDKCYISYNGKKYTYKITDIYYEEKDGTINIKRDHSKTVLTLVTCTRNNNTKQTVYIAELIDVK